MKSTTLLLAILSLLVVSCRKDKTDFLDITSYKWKLKTVTIGEETFKPPKRNDLPYEPYPYVLEFVNDSTFYLGLTINQGAGIYKIPSQGYIHIYTYHNLTELCCDSEFDERLMKAFRKVTTYKIIGKTLIFNGTDIEVKFKKR